MKQNNTVTGAVVFPCRIGGLAILRTLGQRGVPTIGIDSDRRGYGLSSRYCTRRVVLPYESAPDETLVEGLVELGRSLPARYVFFPTSDRVLLLLSRYRDELARYFTFTLSDHSLLERVVSKRGTFQVTSEHGMPTPKALFPRNLPEVVAFSETVKYPCLLKALLTYSPLYSQKLSMVKVSSPEELKSTYQVMAAVDPEIMIQEYIPGEDSQMYLYNAYFNANSEPLLIFTGRKLRQFPINFGAGSLCECRDYPRLERLVTAFCREIRYKGLLDIGLKYDSRDDQFKLLDINPRIGQNFRTFVTRQRGVDLALAAYWDQIGQSIPEKIPREGRRWIIEDSDLISSLKYHRLGRLSLWEWVKSFRGLEEFAFLSFRDPLPWMKRYAEFQLRPMWSKLKKAFAIRSVSTHA
ncbi:MAG: hypothetical protein NTU56_02245 [Proteobacteria bacterium]|nr:hypothetical protein [Pseudomonadota bacterium]